jgi:hypothetical protein
VVRKRRKRKNEECKKCFGNANPELTFYVIRIQPPGAGLFANFNWVLSHVAYALEKGYMPVVDMENYQTFFNETTPINGTYNAWEYYFNQPTQYTLSDAYKSKNVILSDARYYFGDKICPFFGEEQIHFVNTIINKYLRFNDKTLEYINNQQCLIFKDFKDILGVKHRGTDYNGGAYHNHSNLPSVDAIITKTKELFAKWDMKYVYLSTEEAGAVNKFRDVWGDNLIMTNIPRIEKYERRMGQSSQISFGRENDNYQKGLDYIVDTILLSRCDALIAAGNNGTLAAIEFNGNRYKYKYILERV